MFKNVTIISRTDKEDAVKLADRISSYLESKGIAIRFEKEIALKLGRRYKAGTDLASDLILTIGGDGTVLRAFHVTGGAAPIFPVRMGTVGFLCDEDWEHAMEAIDRLLRGEYTSDRCFTLQSNLDTPFALNEFRVGCPLPSHPIDVEVSVDEHLIARDKLDGIIVSTNTGASAYAFSAGANIIDPRLEAIMVVPICTLSTNFKPYVVPSDSTILIELISEGDLMTLVDGEYHKHLSGVREIKIFKSPRTATILRTGWSFYQRLGRRLNISSAR